MPGTMKPKWKVYQQSICGDCIQMLANGESNHTPEELARMESTLAKWAKENYEPAGLIEDCEPSFSWNKCDLCNGLAGDRFEYNFFDKN